MNPRTQAAGLGIAVLAGATLLQVGAADASPAPASPPTAQADWEQVTPGEPCMCADGSEYSLWLHRGDPGRVVLFLEGGGACFSAESCAFAEGSPYQYTFAATDNPTGTAYNPNTGETDTIGGIFDFADAANPLADYSVVYVPYCTGDAHLGNTTRDYSDELTVEHRGFVNGGAALGLLAETFPDAEQVVVVGESAGAIAAPVYAGLVADELPDASVTALMEGGGAYPPIADLYGGIAVQWGVTLPEWAYTDPASAAWTAPELTVQAAEHDPEIVWARHDYTADAIQSRFFGLLGLDPAQLAATMTENEVLIEANGVDLDSYEASGEHHTVFQHEEFYTEHVDGVALTDWVAALVAGDEIEDVG